MRSEKVVFIAGASAGIGEALAEEYARQGAAVFLAARRLERLEALASKLRNQGARVGLAAMDVSDTASVDAAVKAATDQFGRLDVMVANAGFGVAGQFEELSLEDYRRQFETNIFGVLRCAKAALPWLKKSQGSLCNIGSVNGWIALGGGSPYGMSKHAVRALSDSLWQEFHAYGVSVTHISPGFIDTEIRRVDNYGQFKPVAKDPIPAWLRASPEHAARVIRRAISARKREKSITGHGWLVIRLVRYFPWFSFWLIKSLRISGRKQP